MIYWITVKKIKIKRGKMTKCEIRTPHDRTSGIHV